MRRQRPTAKSRWNRPGVGSVPPAMSTLDFLQTTNAESVASTGRCPHMYPICHCEERSDVASSPGLHRPDCGRPAIAPTLLVHHTNLLIRTPEAGTMRRQRPTAKSRWNRPGVGSVPPAMSTLDFLQTTNAESVASTGRCPHMYPICHCEERSDVAISMRLNARRATAVATTTSLPSRYALRNDSLSG